MVDRSLILLSRLRFGAFLRKIRRGMSTKRGIAFTAIGGAVFVMWLLPAILGAAVGQMRHDPAQVRERAPLIMLAMTLVMSLLSGGKIITFSAAEIDHLFAGPYTRHQLVLYKIAVTAFATIWVALLVSMWQWRSVSMWFAGFLGIWLAWLFAQSMAMLIVLARQAITARRSSMIVRLGLGLLLLLVLAGAFEIVRPVLRGNWDIKALLHQSRDTAAARIVLAPFDVLTRAFTAQRLWPDLVQSVAISCGMIVVLIGLILRLDEYFVESSLAVSEQVQARVQRMRRSGGGAVAAARPIRSLRLPMLPRMGGVGPVLWRQLMIALRGARGLLLILMLLAFGVGPLIWAMSRNGAKTHELAIPAAIGGATWLTFVLPSILKFDFRGDLAHLDTLKLLPLRPSVVAVGQMLAPVIVITLLTWILAAVASAAAPAIWIGALAAAAVVPPLVALVIGVENAMFLMFPTAQQMTTPGDMSMLGRTMVTVFIKMMVIMLTLGIVGGAGTGLYFLTHSWLVTIASGWILLACGALATVPIVARLFARFDPSMDKPGE